MRHIVLIAHNVRSAHNVGSLLRTADGLGIKRVYLTGYTPYPKHKSDKRLPHLAAKTDKQIIKTALGAEKTVHWQHEEKIEPLIDSLKKRGFTVAGLEQTPTAVKLFEFESPEKLAVVVGNEVEGLADDILQLCNLVIKIPMFGQKESFNVVQAAAMALYHARFMV